MILVEGCVTSVEEALLCQKAGADRLELCRDLATGGLTPIPEIVAAVTEAVDIPVMVMIRPKAGSFVIGNDELEDMLNEINVLTETNVSGFVVGAITRQETIDPFVVRMFVRAAQRLPVTFHRAFDEIEDQATALAQLADCGIQRVLTSGGAESAWAGRFRLASLKEMAHRHLTIVGGGAIRGDHAVELIRATGLTEIHARAEAIPELVKVCQAAGLHGEISKEQERS